MSARATISEAPARTAARRIWRHPWTRLGGCIVGTVILAALGADLLVSAGPDVQDLDHQLASPSMHHWLGTDENGRDLLGLIVHGARIALWVAIPTVLISTVVGTALGAVAGFFGGKVDGWIMRLTDVVMAFPGVLLAILILFITQRPGLGAVILSLCATGWAGYARLVRGQVLAERGLPYVEACQALGLGAWRTLVRHVLPQVTGPLLVQATFGLAGAIVAEASLSFLGLGPQGAPSWGALLDQGATYFAVAPHLALFPGIAIATTVLGIQFLGDGLRDVLDPHQSQA